MGLVERKLMNLVTTQQKISKKEIILVEIIISVLLMMPHINLERSMDYLVLVLEDLLMNRLQEVMLWLLLQEIYHRQLTLEILLVML